MINVSGHDSFRGGQKIGYIQNNDIFSHDGKKLDYVSCNHVFNRDGRKLAYLEGDYVYHTEDSQKMKNVAKRNIFPFGSLGKNEFPCFTLASLPNVRIEDNHQHVNGGAISDVLRAAARVLLED